MQRHLFNIMLKKHGSMPGAAKELGIGVNTLHVQRKRIGSHDEIPEDPMADCEILVDMLREYLDLLVPDQRVLVMNNVADGYCRRCGSSGACPC